MAARAEKKSRPGVPKPDPEILARSSVVNLESLADPRRAAGQHRYFKEQVAFLGLTSPQIKEIEAGIWEKVRGAWVFSDAVAYAEAMLSREFHEVRALGLLILLRFRGDFPPSFSGRVRRWLRADRLDNWALVDVFCPDALGPMLENNPGFVKEIKTWTDDPNRWVKRASAVSFIKLARRGKCLDAVYEISARLFPAGDDLIHKATGWLLREAGKTDRPRLRMFLLKHGPAIPRTTLRYAIEHFSEQERQNIMNRTKAKKA